MFCKAAHYKLMYPYIHTNANILNIKYSLVWFAFRQVHQGCPHSSRCLIVRRCLLKSIKKKASHIFVKLSPTATYGHFASLYLILKRGDLYPLGTSLFTRPTRNVVPCTTPLRRASAMAASSSEIEASRGELEWIGESISDLWPVCYGLRPMARDVVREGGWLRDALARSPEGRRRLVLGGWEIVG